MADKCDLCLLGLIILSSLLTEDIDYNFGRNHQGFLLSLQIRMLLNSQRHFASTSGVNENVFISSGENVRLPCNNALSDCKSTTWIYNSFRSSGTVELIGLGIKKKNTERHERLNLGSDCSLNIKNVTEDDSGLYSSLQFVNGEQGADAHVYLHVLHVSVSPSSSSSSSSQTEISPGRSVTLSCQVYSGFFCDYWVRSEGLQLSWVNQAGVDLTTDSRYQILFSSDHCIITLTTTLLNEDDNREWRCQLTLRNQLQTSVRYTVKYSDPADTASETEVSVTAGSLFRVIVIIVEMAVFAAPTVILLQIICARRAGRKDSQHPEEIEMPTILQ
ncbi:uncharacterized protein LOC127508160 isoform X5 [Ctenopharyngodon idella]|uniref:uncharacterized protein LOC127508160 isoform X5 n=1 Tax=Ctenopharyngodon idella TaxID=7959 RepID=UPI002230CD50|nr:uncharacterized protein LOC127508160 isoform X5 [Ctenopharyngodon idella]